MASQSQSSRSRRVLPPPDEVPASRPSSASPSLSTLLCVVLMAGCFYLLSAWQPVDMHNIGGVRADAHLAYGPIDVVYTWVNGTDPRWKREKEYWHKHWIASLTGQPLPRQPEDTKHVKGADVANADNRFRDNEELRYSLRSLLKYAPWIRNIYIVTDGQVPSWLNLEAPHLHIVKHRDIFANKSHLPVFSSPAIEWNLDNIPGLSENFIYFNDDVFLGSHVHPEDFVSPRGVQQVYFAWEAPLCSPGCWDMSLRNGRCDAQCNVTACDFDMGDCGCDVDIVTGDVSCDAAKIATIQEAAATPVTRAKTPDHLCSGSCHYRWLGDGSCDRACNISACGFDAGDCDSKPSMKKTATTTGTETETGLSPSPSSLLASTKGVPTASIVSNHTLVQVPLRQNITYLNLTAVFGLDGRVTTASHDNEPLIRYAAVFEHEMTLLLVFGRDERGLAMTSTANILVEGEDARGNTIALELSVVRGQHMVKTKTKRTPKQNITASGVELPVVPIVTTASGAGFATYLNSSVKPRVVRLPIGFRHVTWRARDTKPPAASPMANESTTATTNDPRADAEPYLEVFLPFNVTGKILKHGEEISLGVDAMLRVHGDKESEIDNEEYDADQNGDIHWHDFQTCILTVPEAQATSADPVTTDKVKSAATANVVAKGEDDSNDDSDHDSGSGSESSTSSGSRLSDDAVVNGEETSMSDAKTAVGQTTAIKEATVDAATGDVIVKKGEEEGDKVLRCGLVKDGIQIKIPMPTFRNLYELDDDSDDVVDDEGEDEDEDEDKDQPEKESGDPTNTESPENTKSDESPTDKTSKSTTNDATEPPQTLPRIRPQVMDGEVCFYNTENSDKKYCFIIALGHYHARRVVVTPRPPSPQERAAAKAAALMEQMRLKREAEAKLYAPYHGDNPAWVEFLTHCRDTSRRLIGLRPKKCYVNEVPAVSLPADDPSLANEEEGRRLACDAMQRRQQRQQERVERSMGRLSNDGSEDESLSNRFTDVPLQLLSSVWHRVSTFLGVEMLEHVAEDLEDIEYEDVCRPLLDEERASNPVSKENAEALLSKDTFGDSLRFVNKLYNRAFGKASSRRRVPSHMPFLLNRERIREIKERWHKEIEATSAHRFRHPQDMQFSFSYFHYLLNRHKIKPPTLEYVWHEYLDVNRNGILDENELLTVASLAHGDYPTDEFVTKVKMCLRPAKQEKVREQTTARGKVLVAETLTPHIQLEHLAACPEITEPLLQHIRTEKQFVVLTEQEAEREVTFHMLSDQYRVAWNQMLGTRARRTKFVCINDDMKFPSSAVSQILHELFLSIWPKRSQFELPYHLKNRYDHIDDYMAARERRQWYATLAGCVVLVVLAIFWRDIRRLFGFQDLVRARAASASHLTAELRRQESEREEELMSKKL